MKAAKDNQTTIQNVNIKIDPVVKESAESVLANMGLNMSAYIGMCLRKLAQDREIPFTQKADPEFWATEYRAYKTKKIVDSGIIHPVLNLYRDLIKFITEAGDEIGIKLFFAEVNGTDPDTITFANDMLGNITFGKSLSVAHRTASTFLETMSSNFLWDTEPFTLYKEALKSIDEKILDGCFEITKNADTDIAELFATVFDFDMTEDYGLPINREDSVFFVDQLFSYAVDAYNENPDSIVLRYTGQVGGSALAIALSSASIAQDALSKCCLNVKYKAGNASSIIDEFKDKISESKDAIEGGEQND